MLLAACALLICAAGCARRGAQQQVVVYCALDRGFSESLLNEFSKRTGIKVLPKFDTESTKTVGLVNAIRAEKARPRCDVFWNNEIVNTIRLKKEGLLQQYRPAAAANVPAHFRDPDGYWTGLAARGRVLLINTNLTAGGPEPDSIRSLADPRWKGRGGMAKPLFGTTATHAACLFAALGDEAARKFFSDVRNNGTQILSGNKTVATSVSEGRIAFGLTDTDDAIIEVESGCPVRIVYPDSQAGGSGVLFIPNTVAIVRGAPNPDAARKLVDYILSPEVEIALARAESAQIPLNTTVTEKTRVCRPGEVEDMKVDFNRAAELFDTAASCVKELFLD